jgi:hypothetical protein
MGAGTVSPGGRERQSPTGRRPAPHRDPSPRLSLLLRRVDYGSTHPEPAERWAACRRRSALSRLVLSRRGRPWQPHPGRVAVRKARQMSPHPVPCGERGFPVTMPDADDVMSPSRRCRPATARGRPACSSRRLPHSALRVGAARWGAALATGSVTVKRAPRPGLLSTVTDPRIASVSSLTIARPRPVPTERFVRWRS